MSEGKDTGTEGGAPQGSGPRGSGPDVAEEHPLSLVLFAPLRTAGGQAMILWGLVLACVVFGAAGFLVEPGHHFEIEGVPLFFGVFGFVAFAGAVLSGWPLGKLLRRPEGFYERKGSDVKETSDD